MSSRWSPHISLQGPSSLFWGPSNHRLWPCRVSCNPSHPTWGHPTTLMTLQAMLAIPFQNAFCAHTLDENLFFCQFLWYIFRQAIPRNNIEQAMMCPLVIFYLVCDILSISILLTFLSLHLFNNFNHFGKPSYRDTRTHLKTDEWLTNWPMDRRTDKPSYRYARTHLQRIYCHSAINYGIILASENMCYWWA